MEKLAGSPIQTVGRPPKSSEFRLSLKLPFTPDYDFDHSAFLRHLDRIRNIPAYSTCDRVSQAAALQFKVILAKPPGKLPGQQCPKQRAGFSVDSIFVVFYRGDAPTVSDGTSGDLARRDSADYAR